jgi:hypothetical protein
VIDLFDTITKYYEGNRFHKEGWKTNKNWKIQKKIIVPWGIEFTDYARYGGSDGHFNTLYCGHIDWLDDLDKIFRILNPNGNGYNTIKSALNNRFNQLGNITKGQKFDNTFETYFVTGRFWKKGTLHLTIKDDDLLEKLNVMGANYRRDLGYEV